MKIAFFLDYIKERIDYRNPEVLNPGLGGTQYLIWTMSYYLSIRDNGLDVILFAPKGTEYCPSIKVITVDSVRDCVVKSKDENVDFLILHGPNIPGPLIKTIKEVQIPVILWTLNFENHNTERALKQCPYIVGNICASHEQNDLLLDTALYNKSHVIYNGLDFSQYKSTSEKDNKTVCYMGSLLPSSGYDTFLKAWDIVQKKIPDVKLNIIGGKDLYSQKDKGHTAKALSNLKRLEDKVLRNPDGELNPNIRFWGVLGGKKKLEVMRSATIGLANLTPGGETFGLSVVEFEALGIPVVSLKYRGLRETVKHKKTGILGRNYKEIAGAIIYLLNHNDTCVKLGRHGEKYVRENFSLELILNEWEKYIKGQETQDGNVVFGRYAYDGKGLIAANYLLRKPFPFLPSHFQYVRMKNLLRKVVRKIGQCT